MPYRVTFALDADKDSRERLENLGALLDCMTRIDEVYLETHPGAPLLAQSGVRLDESEDWHDVPTCLKMGVANPDDLTCWSTAEQRIRFGIGARPALIERSRSERTMFVLDAFNGKHDLEESLKDLSALLDCLIQVNEAYLIRRPNTPPLYKSGVRYREEPRGQEDWQDIPTTLKMGIGDCEDLSCWLVAERRVRFGIAAQPYIIPQLQQNGNYLYHIAVSMPGAPGRPPTIEDPSRALGMR